jgi:tRNA-splicing ligase RtcB
MTQIALRQLDQWRWLVPRKSDQRMRTDGLIFADETLIADLRDDLTLKQVANVATLPGIVGKSLAMPDAHAGYGFPIGGVAAFDMDEGVISPGGVGYDINCGVRLLRTDLSVPDVQGKLEDLAQAIFNAVPSGVGKSGAFNLSTTDLRAVLSDGARWPVKQGYGTEHDLAHTEAEGRLPGADPDALSSRAFKRGSPQLATLGAGNHFLEIQAVDTIEDPDIARAFGIDEVGQVCVMIHTGSRGLGHQVCDDAIGQMLKAAQKYGIELADRQLACAPVNSPEGQHYFAAMAAAANYAWANRQTITHQVRSSFEKVLRAGPGKLGMRQVYDVAHNIAKFEHHQVGGHTKRLCVHRKGATRAFGPGHPEVPAAYRTHGQPVLVPGDMGTGSHLLVGTQTAMEQTWGSTCHGAGRRMSRSAAIRAQHGSQVYDRLTAQGIVVRSAGKKTLAEEAPEAYKNVDQVVAVCHGADISRRVARLRPLAVVKG